MLRLHQQHAVIDGSSASTLYFMILYLCQRFLRDTGNLYHRRWNARYCPRTSLPGSTMPDTAQKHKVSPTCGLVEPSIVSQKTLENFVVRYKKILYQDCVVSNHKITSESNLKKQDENQVVRGCTERIEYFFGIWPQNFPLIVFTHQDKQMINLKSRSTCSRYSGFTWMVRAKYIRALQIFRHIGLFISVSVLSFSEQDSGQNNWREETSEANI